MLTAVPLKRSIKRLVRARVAPWLQERDLLPSPASTGASLAGFFDSVRPVRTNHALIRLGGDGDGGYLVPDDLEGIRTCFSPGVSEVADFELSLADRSIHCFLADYSVAAPPVVHPKFSFEKKYLGTHNDEVFMTLRSWVDRHAPGDCDLILQMDIEGAEYGVILDASDELLRQFRVIVVEFHELQGLCDRLGFTLISMAFQKLLKSFDIVHIHPNNCRPPAHYQGFAIPPVMEFSFLRKDRIADRQPAVRFPHPLDRRNLSDVDDLTLPACWYK